MYTARSARTRMCTASGHSRNAALQDTVLPRWDAMLQGYRVHMVQRQRCTAGRRRCTGRPCGFGSPGALVAHPAIRAGIVHARAPSSFTLHRARTSAPAYRCESRANASCVRTAGDKDMKGQPRLHAHAIRNSSGVQLAADCPSFSQGARVAAERDDAWRRCMAIHHCNHFTYGLPAAHIIMCMAMASQLLYTGVRTYVLTHIAT